MRRLIGLAFLALPVMADAANVNLDYVMATGRLHSGQYSATVIINTSTSSINMPFIYKRILESCHNHWTFPRAGSGRAIMPQEAYLNTGLNLQLPVANHLHTQARLNVPKYMEHAHHQVFTVLFNADGTISQFLGPAEHGHTPTMEGMRTLPGSRYQYRYSSVGYQADKYDRLRMTLINGSRPNRVDLRVHMSELPWPSPQQPWDLYSKDLGLLQPNEVKVVDVNQDLVWWAHHMTPTISMSVLQGATWYVEYTHADGAVYGLQNKTLFHGPGTETFPTPPCPVDRAATSPTQGSTVAVLTPTITWNVVAPPDPFATSLYYKVRITSHTTFDNGQWTINDTVSSCCSYTVPAGRLAPGTAYRLRINAAFSLPGIETPPGEPLDTWQNEWWAAPERLFYTPP